jgi:hypothetical protein
LKAAETAAATREATTAKEAATAKQPPMATAVLLGTTISQLHELIAPQIPSDVVMIIFVWCVFSKLLRPN